MDTSLIFIIFVFIVLWWDNKRRNKKIKECWEEVGGEKVVVREPMIQETLPKDSPPMTPKEIAEILQAWSEIEKKPKLSPNDEKLIEKSVEEVLNNMTSNDAIKDATMALKRLGYKQGQIKSALSIVLNSTDKLKMQDIIKNALLILNN